MGNLDQPKNRRKLLRQILLSEEEHSLENWSYDVILGWNDVISSTTQLYNDTSNLSPITC